MKRILFGSNTATGCSGYKNQFNLFLIRTHPLKLLNNQKKNLPIKSDGQELQFKKISLPDQVKDFC